MITSIIPDIDRTYDSLVLPNDEVIGMINNSIYVYVTYAKTFNEDRAVNSLERIIAGRHDVIDTKSSLYGSILNQQFTFIAALDDPEDKMSSQDNQAEVVNLIKELILKKCFIWAKFDSYRDFDKYMHTVGVVNYPMGIFKTASNDIYARMSWSPISIYLEFANACPRQKMIVGADDITEAYIQFLRKDLERHEK